MFRKTISALTLLFLLASSVNAQQLILQGSVDYPLGPITFIDSADHISGKTGCTSPSVKKISKGFGAAATPSGTWTQLDSTNFPGVYYITGHATDTATLGLIIGHFECTGADPVDVVFGQVVSFDPHGVSASVQNLVDGVYNAAVSGYTTTGTFGKRLGVLPEAAPGASGGLFISGSNATTTVNFTGNLSGSVGSVTGNVGGNVTGNVTGNVGGNVSGNVTGNVGGNVTGSTASIGAGVFTIKKNVAFNNYPIWMVNSSGAGVPAIAGSISCKLVKDGSTSGTLSQTITQVDATNLPGLYVVNLTATELNANIDVIRCVGPAGTLEFRATITPQR